MAKHETMSPEAFHAALLELGLETYDQAAEALGSGRRSLVRYGTGTLPVPRTLENLLAAELLLKSMRAKLKHKR
jgi:hypothetical protein